MWPFTNYVAVRRRDRDSSQCDATLVVLVPFDLLTLQCQDCILRENTYDAQIVKTGPPFLHSSPFYSTPKVLCFTMLFNRPDTPKCPFPWRHLHPHVMNTWFLDPPDSAFQTASRSVQSFLHSSGQAVPILSNARQNAINARLKT